MKAAVICSKGIGDGLMMMVASHRLRLEKYEVTTFQDTIGELSQWFPGHVFSKRSTIKSLDSFDLILLQNDNTPFSFNLIDRYRDRVHVFYAGYEKAKNRPLTAKDCLFNRFQPMVINIAQGVASILGKINSIQENGLTIPKGLVYRKYQKRLVIHPTSTVSIRNWTAQKFIKVAQVLEKKGYTPIFSVSPSERKEWETLLQNRFPLPEFSTIHQLAAYLYESYFLIGNESGPGHLASNLGIPTLIVASCARQMTLWRPGFFLGTVMTPPSYIPNFKFMRLREKKWQTFIAPRHILKAFYKMQRS